MTQSKIIVPSDLGFSAVLPSNLVLTGHSYMDPRGIGTQLKDTNQSPAKNGEIAPTNRYSTGGRIASALGVPLGRTFNWAVSGAVIRSHAQNGTARYLQLMNPGTNWYPQIPKYGVGVGWWGTNDAIFGTSDTIKNGFIRGYRSLISRFRACGVRDANDATVTTHGTWTWHDYSTDTVPWGSGAGCWESSTVGDYITIALPAGSAHPSYDLASVMMAVGAVCASVGGTFKVEVDGVQVGTFDTFGGNFEPPLGAGGSERGSNVLRFPVTQAAATIKLTVLSLSGGGPIRFDYYQVEATPPNPFLMLEMTLPAAPSWVWAGITAAYVDAFNSWLDLLVAEFGDMAVRKVAVDNALGGGSIRTNGFGSAGSYMYYCHDGLHPQDRGSEVTAGQVKKEYGKMFRDGIDPSQVQGFQQNELSPITAQQQLIYVGHGAPLQLLDGFDSPDTNAPPVSWTPVMGGWGTYQKQLTLVNDLALYPDFIDTFQRADGAPGADWTVRQGGFVISNGELKLTANGPALPNVGAFIESAHLLDASGNGGIEGIVGSVREDWSSLIFRYQDATNFFRLYESVTFATWGLEKYVGGAQTTLASSGLGGSGVGIKMNVEINGNSIKVWRNGVLVYSGTDASLAGQRKVGIGGYPGVPPGGATVGPTWSRFAVRAGPMDTTQDPGFNVIIRDLGTVDGSFGFLAGDAGPVNFLGVVFRWQDKDNYLTLYQSASFGGWVFTKRIAGGAEVVVSTIAGPTAPGTSVGVMMAGNTFTFTFNSVPSATGPVTLAGAPTGTKAGFRADYVNVMPLTLPAKIGDNFQFGGTSVFVPDNAYYEDLDTGTRYGPFSNGSYSVTKPWAPPALVVTGSKAGNAALASLISKLAQRGIITDTTT